MKVSMRLFDEIGNKADLYSGSAAECPPVPREGEIVSAFGFRGRVMEIEHGFEAGPDTVYIDIRISEI